jgi:hypothetical protein
MAQYNLQKTMLGSTLYFIESGLTVEGAVVGPTIKPDITPTTNWRTLGCVNELTPYQVTEEDTPFTCFEGTRYRQESSTVVLQDGWEFTLKNHCEPIYRLMLGLDAEFSTNAATVIPYKKNIRQIYGYLKFQAKNVNKDQQIWTMDLWGKLEMIEMPTYNDKSVFPRLRFINEDSAQNAIKLENIANTP